ncbi:MAG: sigma-70 family RNA polymerase sigma factor [Elusimicrobia bacterium]|nr:sigma-70 family RNA polymerase sigma factor [Elusimicrobiota bacterium]
MTGNENEFELLRRFSEGDEAAFAAVLARWEKPLFNFICRLLPERTEAEDIAQEVFLKVAAAAGTLRERARFSTYLFRITYNLCIDRIRRRTVRAAGASFVSLDETAESGSGEKLSRQVPDPSDLPADLLRERLETKTSVEKALLQLPENQRAAIMLKVYEDRPYAEIAEILGVSLPSVESLLFRARQNLKNLLKQ